jgi:hypothetical protein
VKRSFDAKKNFFSSDADVRISKVAGVARRFVKGKKNNVEHENVLGVVSLLCIHNPVPLHLKTLQGYEKHAVG